MSHDDIIVNMTQLDTMGFSSQSYIFSEVAPNITMLLFLELGLNGTF